MAQVSDTEETAVVEQTPVAPKEEGMRVGVVWVAVFSLMALVLGLVGGIVSHAMFPAPAGAVGKQGPVGQTGPAGPAGSAGTASSVDTSTLGYCFNVNYTTQAGTSWVSSVTLASPTLQSGTQSCPTGSFVPIAAQPSN
jgi:hypothetical protein